MADEHGHEWFDVIQSKGERVTFEIKCACGAIGVEVNE